jgi:hypothetical protein
MNTSMVLNMTVSLASVRVVNVGYEEEWAAMVAIGVDVDTGLSSKEPSTGTRKDVYARIILSDLINLEIELFNVVQLPYYLGEQIK